MKRVVEHLVGGGATDAERETLLKLVDEYNYVRFTLTPRRRSRSASA
jgi:hypothetical protein